MEVRPIGFVKSAVTQAVDENWGQVVAEIHLRPDLAPGLIGLDGFSHAIVLYFMHEADYHPRQDVLRHPRGRQDLPLTGIFAQRARHRPNPIGLTAVQVVAVHDAILTVRGLDAIDGTPVLDIKPYTPMFDRIEQPRIPAWLEEIMKGYF
jgi:tRNA (adenine37-N6)-methyltransferase